MSHVTAALFAFILRSGGVGLLILGILDSSFLFAPWGNDLLVVAMTAQHRHMASMLYYAIMSAVGSVLGCLLIDLVVRPLGEQGIEKHLSARNAKRVVKKVREHSGRTLALASLVPPPFPFTAFVIAASAVQYCRKRMLLIIAATRLVRFVLLGLLALRFGEGILNWAEKPAVQAFLIGLIVFCIAGSVISVYGWLRRARAASPA